jgi:DNA invertase Pin-like site-specific DNA recombinase
LQIAEEWQKSGIQFVCTSQGIETITASGRLVYAILGAMAEFERELISERTKEGMKKAKNVGKRGKDKDQRKKGGYYLRYQKKGGMVNHV